MKKRLVSIAAALLFAMPGTAMAQQAGWIFPEETAGAKQQCFGMAIRTDRAFAFQAPTPGQDNEGVFAFFGPEDLKDQPGDIVINFSVSGKWAGDHVGTSEDQPGTSAYLWQLDSWRELDSFPDNFHVTIRKGGVKVFDGDVTGFRAALTKVKQCVARRGG
ncbi:MAG: hypothetical protein ACAH11_10795 [Sphingomonas sp.]